MRFAHLHCRSAYSLFEGTARPQALVGAARRLGMPALAITDRNSMYGAVAFYSHAQKAGIKPIIGMEVDLDTAGNSGLVLLARNLDGYRNLCHLASIIGLNADPRTFSPAGYDEDDEEQEIPLWDPGVWGVPVFGFTGKPPALSSTTNKASVRELLLSGRYTRGLLALSGGRRGAVNSLVMRGKMGQSASLAGVLLSAFGEGNFFIEMTALDEEDKRAMPLLAELADNLHLPIVASNDVLYLTPDDAPAALALASMRAGPHSRVSTRPRLEVVEGQLRGDPDLQKEVSTERYFKSAEQMAELFKDYPQALANTHYITDRCDLELPLHRPLFPSAGLRHAETPYSKLWKLCFAGATRIYRPLTGAVLARLNHELGIIEGLGFSPYFLVVHDIVRFARSHDIPVLARGSAANSLVAYLLGITQVDPLANNLLFERFLNPSRAEFEMPDIDLDLCWRRRDEVLHYIYERYGRDHVATVGTYITFRLRSAWREMAKALGIGPGRIGYVASRLPHSLSAEDLWSGASGTLPELEDVIGDGYAGGGAEPDEQPKSPRFRDEQERMAFELCKTVEGLPRHAGMHCAGLVITPQPIVDLVPLQRAARDPTMAITQYDKDAVDALGLVKMDLLGSRALTTLVDAMQSCGLMPGKGTLAQSLEAIPGDDERTYRMMAEGDTLGCFQLESPGMRGLLKWLRPRSLGDVAAAVSLFRPGPLEGGFLETFMRRHLGQEPVSYHHPAMEPVLRDTHGVILYQEQFLMLAHSLAGLSMGEAEKLRKHLGKARSPEERAALGKEFVAGAIERGIDQLQAERVWEIIAGYTGFGFCKAHAYSYAATAYRSAYVKAHHSAHYIAALLNNQGGFYGPTVYVEDARRLGIKLLLPHVNASGAWCEVPHGTRSIRLGLQFIKGLFERTIAAILQERRSRGPFHSLTDLMSRVPAKPNEWWALVKSGACDDLEDTINDLPPTPDPKTLTSLHPPEHSPIHSVLSPQPSVLNRRQMAWLLPALLSSGPTRHWNRLSSKDRPTNGHAPGRAPGSVQLVVSEHAHDGHRVLGSRALNVQVPDLPDYTLAERVQLEQEVFGFPLSCNQFELYRDRLEIEGIVPSNKLGEHRGREVTVAGTIVAGRRHMSSQGGWMLFLTLQDANGLIEVVLFPDAYKQHGKALVNGHGPYLVRGQVQTSGKGRGIGVQPPSNLRPTDALSMKVHPIVIAASIEPLQPTQAEASANHEPLGA